MDSCEYPTVILNGEKARKRSVSASKRTREKENRHKQKRPPIVPKCNHRRNAGAFQCNSLNGTDVMKFAKSFYASTNKIAQDSFLLTYASALNPIRRDKNSSLKRAISVVYYIRKANKSIARVCQTAFCGILGIKKDRIVRLAKRHLETGLGPVERRGGDRIGSQNQPKKDAVINFIKKFKTIEIHYCRSLTTKRQYLPSELNVNKMYRMFIAEPPELNIKKCYFRNIFNNSFNIGFKTPASDLCSMCIMLKERMKFETNGKKKQDLMVKMAVHKRRAKAFFDLLREEADDLATISFDCQKNMLLPKVADQAAYYSRQIYMHNFGIVMGSSRSSLTQQNVFLYSCTENLFSKGWIEIASAVHHRLGNLELENKKRVRLVADGCGGQNKNTIMIGMCCHWLLKEAPVNITTLELIFPIPGPSYMPPDRVFAKLEKEICNRQCIIKPDEYIEINKTHATVINLGDVDCPVRDWKTEAQKIIRPPASWHFKFSEAKRFIISKSDKKILVRGEIAYKSDVGSSKSILKRGKFLSQMHPIIVEPGVELSEAKLTDVKSLLQKHFGENWSEMENLHFYKNILLKNANATLIINVPEDPICEAQDQHEGLRI